MSESDKNFCIEQGCDMLKKDKYDDFPYCRDNRSYVRKNDKPEWCTGPYVKTSKEQSIEQSRGFQRTLNAIVDVANQITLNVTPIIDIDNKLRCVVIESPYAGDTELNTKYLRACMKDCLSRGEAPFASHALYTQPGVLDGSKAQEREHGIKSGLEIARRLDATIVYIDYGITGGMKAGIQHAIACERPIEYRSLWEE